MPPLPLFTGLSAFPLTPANEAGRVDTDALQTLLARICDSKARSIGLLGSTGTYMYLSRAERLRAVEAAVEGVAGRLPIIVGIGALRTDEAAQLARDAAGAGAEALLLAPVSYTPLTQDEVFEHFAMVAAATDLPLCIYNNPSTTHFVFGEDLIRRLAGLPRVMAVKMPLPKEMAFTAEIARLRSRTADDFAIGYSGDWGAAAALLAGADAWYSVVGGLFPKPAAALVEAAQSGDPAATARIDQSFAPLWALFQAHGSLRVMYAALNLLNLSQAAPPRPILPLDRTNLPEVEAAIAGLAGE
ncbi:MAG: dihydrodipicolinate synthase family protein [Alphaproteobacteria bacterium]|nr:dihydrodipicolinate synthase family protein [Alphaproteobacteria bacterium]MBU1551111.1 dihydrodipicolinate synthase family protein [Alphaproteobacteria bacterium]MBU2335020.1 dihydrodipicolinate synthase family protein [Alphaproteobacteria bacterium]MBU2388790.1 dihydrodipicolinate synthase family protein [Alphaproteobacteria bacterium]